MLYFFLILNHILCTGKRNPDAYMTNPNEKGVYHATAPCDC